MSRYFLSQFGIWIAPNIFGFVTNISVFVLFPVFIYRLSWNLGEVWDKVYILKTF